MINHTSVEETDTTVDSGVIGVTDAGGVVDVRVGFEIIVVHMMPANIFQVVANFSWQY